MNNHQAVDTTNFRSSHRRCPVRKGVLRNFAKFTGKFEFRLSPATLLKKRLWHRCFPVNFAKFLRTSFLQNTFSTEHLWAAASEICLNVLSAVVHFVINPSRDRLPLIKTIFFTVVNLNLKSSLLMTYSNF